MATEKQKRIAWDKAEPIRGKNPNTHRRDKFGNEIYKGSYGENSPKGWEVDHSKPKSEGGTDHPNNLQALQTESNRLKSDTYPGWKPGIDHLKHEMPERRDGDDDTVVARQQPRKADKFEKSPLPVLPKLNDKYKRIASAASKRQGRRSRKNGGTRSIEHNLKRPSRAPSIKIITR